jgi:hypothetical protein
VTLLAAVPGELFALTGGGALWQRHDGGERAVLSANEAAVWSRCATFATRDAHLAALATAARVERASAAAWFDALHARGLIGEARQFLPQPGAAPTPLPAPRLVIRAYQRPLGLERLLTSLEADELRCGVRRDLLVVDDTRDPTHAARTLALVQAAAKRRGVPIGLLGPAQRDRALAQLLASLDSPARAALRVLLDPEMPSAVTGSRTWNLALLLAAGGALSILDDDVEFPLRCMPGGDQRIELADSTEAVLHFLDPEQSFELAPPVQGDVYAELAHWFDCDAGAWLLQRGVSELALPQRRPDELLALHTRCRVIAAVPGLWGGIAFDSSVYLCYSNPDSQASLWRVPYRHQRLEADRVLHGYPRARLATHAVYTPLLLDTRELLPFAGTWGRVDDTLFLAALRGIAVDACFAHVPLLLGHRDIAPRARLARAREAVLLDRNTFLAHLIDGIGQGLRARDRSVRFDAIGGALRDHALASDAELSRALSGFRTHMQQRIALHLSAALDAHAEAPADWREHVAAVVAANQRAMCEERIVGDELALVRSSIAQYGTAAAHWPHLWSVAAELGRAHERSVLCDWID